MPITKVNETCATVHNFHNLLEIESRFAGRYPHNIMQVDVCQQRPVVRLVYLKRRKCLFVNICGSK